jgi:hypothetical protein
MIRFYRNNAIEPGQIIVPGEHWFGSALHCSINWRCSDAPGRGARPLSSFRSAVHLDCESRGRLHAA